MLNRCSGAFRGPPSLALARRSCLAACGGKAADKAASRPPPLVVVAKVEARDVPVEVRAPVDLRPLEQADVGSKTLGYLDAVLVDRGDRVERGPAARAGAARAICPTSSPPRAARWRRRSRRAALARTNFERAKQLAPRRVVSQQELQQAQSRSRPPRPRSRRRKAQIAALAVRLGETRIESPLDGVVVAAAPRSGRAGRARPAAARSSPWRASTRCACSSPSTSATLAGVARRQGRARRARRAARARRFTGKVVRLAPALDPATRTLDAEVQLDNRAGELRPGMYGRGAIVARDAPARAGRPGRARVQISDGKRYVFVARRATRSHAARRRRSASTAATGSRSRRACAPATRSWSAGVEALVRRHEGPRRARRRSVHRRRRRPRDAGRRGAH